MGLVVNASHVTPGQEPVPIAQEARWDEGPVLTGGKNTPAPGFDPRTVQSINSRYDD